MKRRSQKSALKIKIWAAVSFAFLFFVPWPHTIQAQSNTFPGSGNVGIGTTSPQQPLTVSGLLLAAMAAQRKLLAPPLREALKIN